MQIRLDREIKMFWQRLLQASTEVISLNGSQHRANSFPSKAQKFHERNFLISRIWTSRFIESRANLFTLEFPLFTFFRSPLHLTFNQLHCVSQSANLNINELQNDFRFLTSSLEARVLDPISNVSSTIGKLKFNSVLWICMSDFAWWRRVCWWFCNGSYARTKNVSDELQGESSWSFLFAFFIEECRERHSITHSVPRPTLSVSFCLLNSMIVVSISWQCSCDISSCSSCRLSI